MSGKDQASPLQPSTLPPHQHSPHQPKPSLSPTLGSKDWNILQREVMTDTLTAMPAPSSSVRPNVISPKIKELLAHWSQVIARNEVQIARLGPQVDIGVVRQTLQYKFNRMLVYWRMFRLRDLPPEIILNIFHLIVWSTTHPSDGVKQRLRLTWVCKTWRRLMIDDPMLWNAIWFHDAPPYERSWEWFHRAGSSRLDIRLNEVDPKWTTVQDSPKITGQQMSDILDKLFTKLSQIRMLVVIVDSWSPALTVLQKLQSAGNAGTPINIERLEIHRSGLPYIWLGPGFDVQNQPYPAVLFGGQTNSLRYLCLSGLHIDFNDTPLSNLTTLDLRHIAIESSPTLKRFREVLQNCPNLDKLTLDGCGPQLEERRFDHTPVLLPNLKILTLGSFNLSFACFVVAQIDAPRVRDLTLMSMLGSDYIPLIAMLKGRFTQVRILTLYNMELQMNLVGKRTFVRWLDTMPEIGYARFARMNPEVLNLFAENPVNYRVPNEGERKAVAATCHVLCPKFQCMEVQAMPAEAIAKLCRLRKGVGVPMKKLYLNTPWAQKLSTEQLKALQQEATLFIAPLGANTEEENKLLTEGWTQ
ncbi:hypothetical protein JVU11DRAFT_4853 [Chiua virens]|nr:hypothetical protein JVU11DRAFT_4853 [Chiua virens]